MGKPARAAAARGTADVRATALHRIGEPMEVAGAVVFLASPAASLITVPGPNTADAPASYSAG